MSFKTEFATLEQAYDSSLTKKINADMKREYDEKHKNDPKPIIEPKPENITFGNDVVISYMCCNKHKWHARKCNFTGSYIEAGEECKHIVNGEIKTSTEICDLFEEKGWNPKNYKDFITDNDSWQLYGHLQDSTMPRQKIQLERS